ncbi:MAG: methionyl-tRNA formyltransferase [Trueperaceae bacterium]|nr:methionyl-tRNA formyltransferase [Trueperaceae bacterium]
MTDRLRVALFGSPAFGVPVLERLHDEHEAALVVTRPDAPAGRGMRVRPCAVAARAAELGLPLFQPRRWVRNDEAVERLRALDLDVAITAAYGRILPEAVLGVPRHGFLNAHASLLPKLRGAAPVQWALIQGFDETGITVMQTEAGLDTGPIRHVVRTQIGPHETAPDLFTRLADLAADAVSEALRALAKGALPLVPQDDAEATHAPRLTKEDGRIRFADPAAAVYDRWRGVLAWPGSWFERAGERVRVDELARDAGDTAPAAGGGAEPGTVLEVGEAEVRVACGRGAVRLLRVTPAGRRTMAAADWARGAHLGEGDPVA